LGISDDERLLDILSATPEDQPIPNLLLAAIHFLLLGGVRHDLAKFYGSCVDSPLPAAMAFNAFKAFCTEHEAKIRELVSTRRVQTNEVSRSSYLFTAFSLIVSQCISMPLTLIEIGTSAGLLLNWDRYYYDFGPNESFGNVGARVQIQCEFLGNGKPTLSNNLPKVVHRVGIDLHTIDLRNSHEALWLRSLIWPDQPQRMKLCDDAIEQFKLTPARLVKGDVVDVLSSEVDASPVESTICVFHCHTLNQFSNEQRRRFDTLLAHISNRRSINQLSAEWIRTSKPELRLIRWEKGTPTEWLLARVDQHGRWIEWVA
jgi:hypothetical protein